MPQASDGMQRSGRHPRVLLAHPFRIFFLSTALWAALAIPLWVGALLAGAPLPLALPALYWHQHELLFGLLHVAIAGFLLTAVCTWTQTDRLHGRALLCLWLLWVAGRLLMAFGGALPTWLIATVNLAFLPLVTLDAGWRIWQANQYRHLVVLVVLALLWLMQLGFLLRPAGPFAAGAMLVAIALMLVIGGRITPAFSANWLRQQGQDLAAEGIRSLSALDRILLALIGLLLAAQLLSLHPAAALLALGAAVLSAIRLLLWRGWLVRREPLLWMLHLSLLWIPVALLLLAGSHANWWPTTVWLHAAGIGAMGGLILGVISRVVLGHTGRPLLLPRGMVAAFLLIQAAVLLRLGMAFALLPWQPALLLSAGCWSAAFVLFLWRYLPLLTAPRMDGKPG